MAYIANPVNFDGTNTTLTLASALTGIADGVVILFSSWFRVTATGTERRLFTIRRIANTRLTVSTRTTNELYVFGRDAAGTLVLEATGPTVTDTDWHHLLISCDLANAANRAFLVDGVDVAPTWSPYTNTAMDLNPSSTPTATVGGADVTTQPWHGDLADLYFTTPASWFDPSSGGNLAKFIASGAPVDLGADGSTPLGTAPIVYMSGATVDWHTNKGTGSGFTESGALTDGGVPLPVAPLKKFILTRP